jgi:hypothetical protein
MRCWRPKVLSNTAKVPFHPQRLLLVKKKKIIPDDFCVDYRHLNESTIRFKYQTSEPFDHHLIRAQARMKKQGI